MSDDEHLVRSWQEIAEEASHERDPKKLNDLSEELERALDERAKKLHLTADYKVQKKSA